MSCTARPPCTFQEVPLEDISVRWDGDAVGRKAIAYPARRLIFLDRAFWASLREVDARAAILAHERGHIEGARCENCADRRAGEILRREGFTQPRDAARVLLGRLENRDGDHAARELLEGFGLDELRLPSGPGYLLNIARAEGIEGANLIRFLAHLHANGLNVGGVRYSVTVGVDGGVRTDARQLELYAQGRALVDGRWVVVDASKVVTNASSAKNGKHGQRKAVDLWVMLPSGEPLLFPRQSPLFEQLYTALGELGESFGLTWGGRWTSLVDRPHFEEKSSSITTKTGGAALLVFFLIAAAGAFIK